MYTASMPNRRPHSISPKGNSNAWGPLGLGLSLRGINSKMGEGNSGKKSLLAMRSKSLLRFFSSLSAGTFRVEFELSEFEAESQFEFELGEFEAESQFAVSRKVVYAASVALVAGAGTFRVVCRLGKFEAESTAFAVPTLPCEGTAS